jgi:hypothetical protein
MAMHEEPEAVPDDVQRQISVEARMRFAETRSDEIARADSKRWCNRLKAVEIRARSKHVDIHKWQIEVRRAVTQMERRSSGRRDPAGAAQPFCRHWSYCLDALGGGFTGMANKTFLLESQ